MKKLTAIFLVTFCLSSAVGTYYWYNKSQAQAPTLPRGSIPSIEVKATEPKSSGFEFPHVFKEEYISQSQGDEIIAYLQSAGDHGLPVPDVSNLKSIRDNGEKLNNEQKLVLIAYIKDFAPLLHGSRMNWRKARRDWDMRPEPFDASASFDLALQNNDLTNWLENLAPNHDGYRALVGMRNQYFQYVANGGFTTLANFGEIGVGTSSPNVAKLRERLAQEGFVSAPSPTPEVFDIGLEQQLKRFQEANDLKIDGKTDEKTITALNISAQEKLDIIDLNLERERWVPRYDISTRIEANIPSAEVTYFENNVTKLTMNSIIGKTSTKTPSFASKVRTIVLNPPWHVPASISRRQRVQPPGPRNALGRVKFDFENDFSVFLHDTPNHALFSAQNRALSHGCVRLDKPKDLAEILLKPEGYDRARIDEITSTVRTHYIKLKNQTPVLLLYRTAFVVKLKDGSQAVRFANDVYGWDKLLAAHLDPSKAATIAQLENSQTTMAAAP